jgi:membrane-bound metal-dependent hydrolase YbcI (DUF457 family)
MPWTFAHPAAVLPLRRFCPRYLNFPTLLIGSMMPDFWYYVPGVDLSKLAHSAQGTLLACLPAGLLVLCVLRWLRKPLCFLLPQPHRAALMPLAQTPIVLRPALFARVAASLVLGASTHILWDAFTHQNYSVVAYFTVLQATAFQLGGTDVPVSYLLHLLSTVAGVAMLMVAYRNWLRGSDKPACNATAVREDRWRRAVWFSIAVIAFVVAATLAMDVAVQFNGAYAVAVFARSVAVFGTEAFAVLVVASSICCYRRRDKDILML